MTPTNANNGAVTATDTATCAPLEEGWFVRLLFDHRPVFLVVFAIATIFLGYHAMQLRPEASFLRMIPTYNEYIQNYLRHEEDVRSMGNAVRVMVETTQGTIYAPEYLDVLRNVNDELFFIPGVFRAGMQSLWTPNVRWVSVTEEGLEGGPVISDQYDGSPESIEQIRLNVLNSPEASNIVAENFKSSIVYVPLMDKNPETGEPLDYQVFSERLEEIRSKYQNDTIKIHITGFAKVIGDLIEGAGRVVLFFMIAFVILLCMLLYNSRCWKSTVVRAISSSVAVAWQLGILAMMGYGLNPYSMLVPFLMFALGVSHGIQMFNAQAHEMLGGADKYAAARIAYNKLYIPGLAALFTDCIGFALLFVIRIGVIQDIAVGASVGVAVVAISDLMLLPIMMSYTGISERSIRAIGNRTTETGQPIWRALGKLTRRKPAAVIIAISAILLVGGFYVRQDLKVGDLDPGAPELRPDSRYNLDNAFMNANFDTSSDVFVVMLETPKQGNSKYNTVIAADLLQYELRQLGGVQDVFSYVDYVKSAYAGASEGHPKWTNLPRSQKAMDSSVIWTPKELAKPTGEFTPIMVFLKDHKNETLEAVIQAVEAFAAEHNTETAKFLMAAGNAGIEAATNIEVERAQLLMVALVFSVIFVTCWLTFRSIKAATCIVIPLYITSILCEAAMTQLGIGIKVATLPVIAVGVGIGVDYGVYIYNKFMEYLCSCENNTVAYFNTLKTTGRAVTFTGITLAIGVGTWVFSPIKFQGDMGLLLVFMFLWNMIGALCLIPALVCFVGVPRRIDEQVCQFREGLEKDAAMPELKKELRSLEA